MRLKYLAPWGELIPRGYAPSYRAHNRDCVVCYPHGLHWIVRWARDLRFWIMRAGWPGYRDRTEERIYVQAAAACDRELQVSLDRIEGKLRDFKEQIKHDEYRRGWDGAMRWLDKTLTEKGA